MTCRFVRDTVHLRLGRVFISANRRDIEVLRDIADHENFRQNITEIIWDDTRLLKGPDQAVPGFSEDENEDEEEEEEEGDDDTVEPLAGCPRWFARARAENIFILNARKSIDIDRPDHVAREKQVNAQMSISASWAYQQDLLQQQDGILAAETDRDALQYALQRFPSLRKITITPSAHGFLFMPLYETPMIRSLPYGFNYPLPRGWPTAEEGYSEPEALPWHDGSELMKQQWRGFRIVTRMLAQDGVEHHISDLILDVHQLNTGLNCRIFDRPCQEYHDLLTLIRRPDFRRFDLSLLVGRQEDDGWSSFRSGHLRHALSKATNLEHICLHTSGIPDPDGLAQHRPSGGSIAHFNPLHTIFPVDKWPRLRHFGLSNFLVTQDDVMSFLSTLPETVKSVELSFLHFLDQGGNYGGLLCDMRDKLGWRGRTPGERPRVIIGVDILGQRRDGRGVWVNDEVEAFLYGDKRNPFGNQRGEFMQFILDGVGTERDAFNPAHERPNLQPEELQQLGYLETSLSG